MYAFIITKPGAKTSAYVTDMQMFDLQGLINYCTINNFTGNRYWKDPMIRVGKLNDETFGVKSTKNLSTADFEEIFQPDINDVSSLLIYDPTMDYNINKKYPIFKKEVYLKYGIAK